MENYDNEPEKSQKTFSSHSECLVYLKECKDNILLRSSHKFPFISEFSEFFQAKRILSYNENETNQTKFPRAIKKSIRKPKKKTLNTQYFCSRSSLLFECKCKAKRKSDT